MRFVRVNDDMRMDFPTILGISTVSILCIFAILFGIFNNSITNTDSSFTSPLKKEASLSSQINPEKLSVEYHGGHIDPHYPRYPPFERTVQNSHVTVLATIQSSEIKITDESTNQEKLVFGEDEEDFNTVFSKSFNGEITSEELEEIMKQHRIAGVEYLENKVPYSYVTLKIDQYLKDETEQFTDTLVVKIPVNGTGIKENKKVWYHSQSLKSPIGEQAIYMLINYSILSEKNLVKGDFENVYTILSRYDIDNNDTIQSLYSQKVLERIDRYEKRAFLGNYTLENPERYYEIKQWVLPIPLDEAIIRANEQAQTDHLIIDYHISK